MEQAGSCSGGQKGLHPDFVLIAPPRSRHYWLLQQRDHPWLPCAGVREYLQQIRKEFEAMLAENQARPESERLPRSEFEIDPGLREMME